MMANLTDEQLLHRLLDVAIARAREQSRRNREIWDTMPGLLPVKDDGNADAVFPYTVARCFASVLREAESITDSKDVIAVLSAAEESQQENDHQEDPGGE